MFVTHTLDFLKELFDLEEKDYVEDSTFSQIWGTNQWAVVTHTGVTIVGGSYYSQNEIVYYFTFHKGEKKCNCSTSGVHYSNLLWDTEEVETCKAFLHEKE